jgi:hypothetical protein
MLRCLVTQQPIEPHDRVCWLVHETTGQRFPVLAHALPAAPLARVPICRGQGQAPRCVARPAATPAPARRVLRP